jgi:hypothetical protein
MKKDVIILSLIFLLLLISIKNMRTEESNHEKLKRFYQNKNMEDYVENINSNKIINYDIKLTDSDTGPNKIIFILLIIIIIILLYYFYRYWKLKRIEENNSNIKSIRYVESEQDYKNLFWKTLRFPIHIFHYCEIEFFDNKKKLIKIKEYDFKKFIEKHKIRNEEYKKMNKNTLDYLFNEIKNNSEMKFDFYKLFNFNL